MVLHDYRIQFQNFFDKIKQNKTTLNDLYCKELIINMFYV